MRWNGYGTATELSTAAPKTTPSAPQDGGTEWHIATVSDRDTLVSNYFHSLYAHVCVCVCVYLNYVCISSTQVSGTLVHLNAI